MKIKESMVSAECLLCGEVDWANVSYDDPRWETYLAGALVQDAFPEASTDDREILIGARTDMYVCNRHDFWEDK